MKEYTFTVTEPRYSVVENYSKYFKYDESWDGVIRINSIMKDCIIATVGARGTRFDISLVRYYKGKNNNEYAFVISNWGKGFGGILTTSTTYSMYNDERLMEIENPIDRLSATFAIGKLIEIMEEDSTFDESIDEFEKEVG